MPLASVALASVVEQDGVIDNIFVSPNVHEAVGGVVLLAMLVATGWTGRRPLGGGAKVSLITAQVALMVQALIGIKLLDQGLGVAQLYIHYVGGLIPLGLFMAAGWVAWRNPVTQTRVTALLTLAGLLSAGMAFVIGRAYVQGTL
jgi:heme A synthase